MGVPEFKTHINGYKTTEPRSVGKTNNVGNKNERNKVFAAERKIQQQFNEEIIQKMVVDNDN